MNFHQSRGLQQHLWRWVCGLSFSVNWWFFCMEVTSNVDFSSLWVQRFLSVVQKQLVLCYFFLPLTWLLWLASALSMNLNIDDVEWKKKITLTLIYKIKKSFNPKFYVVKMIWFFFLFSLVFVPSVKCHPTVLWCRRNKTNVKQNIKTNIYLKKICKWSEHVKGNNERY